MRIDVTEDNTADILKDIDLSTRKALTAAGLVVESEMKRRAPVDTGNLRRSVSSQTGKDNGGDYVDIGPGTDYAEYVEYGAGGRPAQPYAKPGFDAARPKVDAIMNKELRI